MNAPLTLSTARTPGEQAILAWGDPLVQSLAQLRPWVGDAVEAFAAALFGVARGMTVAGNYCADLIVDAGHLVEVKSVHRGRQCTLYVDRLERDRRLVADGASLVYAFVVHDAKLDQCKTRGDVRASMACAIEAVHLVPFAKLDAVCAKLPKRQLWVGGPIGMRLPWADITTLAGSTIAHRFPSVSVYGHQTNPVTVHGWSVGDCLPALTDAERAQASEMLFELATQRLEVCLVPAPNPRHAGHQVRCLVNENPDWYRRLAKRSMKKRRPNRHRGRRWEGTDLRRHLVEQSLERLSNGGRLRYPYDFMLAPIVKARAQ